MTIVPDVLEQGVPVEQRRRGKERRVSQRLPLAVPIFARGFDERGKEFLEFTTTLNISATGALLAMRRYLPPDTSISLEIPAAPLPRLESRPQMVRTLQAHVVRVVRSEPSYLWALSFNHPIT
jgi:hypothetical protein